MRYDRYKDRLGSLRVDGRQRNKCWRGRIMAFYDPGIVGAAGRAFLPIMYSVVWFNAIACADNGGWKKPAPRCNYWFNLHRFRGLSQCSELVLRTCIQPWKQQYAHPTADLQTRIKPLLTTSCAISDLFIYLFNLV
jgi:hypothetical protein